MFSMINVYATWWTWRFLLTQVLLLASDCYFNGYYHFLVPFFGFFHGNYYSWTFFLIREWYLVASLIMHPLEIPLTKCLVCLLHLMHKLREIFCLYKMRTDNCIFLSIMATMLIQMVLPDQYLIKEKNDLFNWPG